MLKSRHRFTKETAMRKFLEDVALCVLTAVLQSINDWLEEPW